ncbi:phosphoenolpyruvate carboxykinase (ATP) [Aquibacillus rhizosphaerae]|uniref:Aldolase n=1 Tax=Aquibacillus rhizosphaerae TaxID=3051431 RepID=A0ABT7L310_9BACI|nr:aldolase [Aquibacillus sp. LR5S19]MDL4838975.1 aldolase [Aquibacillus sp. LR5S19]
MIETSKQIYHAFGLNIASDLTLPELPVINQPIEAIDIMISRKELDYVDDSAESASHFVVNKEKVIFHVPNTAVFVIEKGTTIIVSPLNETKQDHIRLYLLGTCMGILLLQRRILPLHGSAIEIDGKAYAIVGDSGAGKSTLATAFLQRGYQLLSDDVIPIVLTADDKPIVIPSYPHQKLWSNTLDYYGTDRSNLKSIFDRETKFAVPVTDQFCTKALPLGGVFELTKTTNQAVSIQSVEKLQQFYTLFRHTYRNFLIQQIGLMDWHFQMATKIASNNDLFKIERPSDRFTAETLTDLIVTTIKKEAAIHE